MRAEGVCEEREIEGEREKGKQEAERAEVEKHGGRKIKRELVNLIHFINLLHTTTNLTLTWLTS